MGLNESAVIIKGLIIRKIHGHAALNTRNIFNLMVKPGLKMIGTNEAINSLPKVGSIVKIRTRFGLRSLVIINDHPTKLQFNSRIKNVFACTREHLMSPQLIHDFKSFMQTHQLQVPKLANQMYVVEGYHYGLQKGKPFVNTTKPYNFLVTNLTGHLEWMKVGHSASVLTQRGKSLLIIHQIKTITDPDQQKQALQHKPVITFHNYGIKNNWIAKIYRNVVLKSDH